MATYLPMLIFQALDHVCSKDEVTASAAKELRKLDRQNAHRIGEYLQKAVATYSNPLSGVRC